jgi:lysophospholipase L1-like esterase
VKRRIVLTAVAISLALAGCEVMARMLFPAPPDPTRQPQIVYRVDPELRYVLSPDQHGWIDDGMVTTNSFGFRGNEIVVPKPVDLFRVVALGDSVTFGWGVNDPDTFCARLEQQLRSRHSKVDVVNLAVPGYATRQEVALLKRNLDRLQPDLVLVGFYSNDLPDTLDDVRPGSGPGTTIAADGAKAGQVLRMNPVPSSWAERQARRSRALYTAVHAAKGLIHRGEGKPGSSMERDLLEGRHTAELEAAWQRVTTQLTDLKDASEASGFAVGLVVLPPREQVMGRFAESDYQKRVRDLAQRFGFFVVDPLPALAKFEGRKDRLFIPYDRNHPSPEGHRLIADAIARSLDDRGIAFHSPRVARTEGMQ